MTNKSDSERLPLPDGVRTVLLALSGGPDSMYLLHKLLPLREEGKLRLYAAHLDHGLRVESREEAAFLQAHCAKLGVPLAVHRADVAAEAIRLRQGIEETARHIRYDFLRHERETCAGDCIALGHHMDDQVETILLHLGRGSGLTGLCAMRAYRPPLWRPLLDMRKTEILAFLKKENIPFCVDPSNEAPDYARNRTRKLLGDLDGIHPRFVENAARSAARLQGDEDFMQGCAEKTAQALLSAEGLDAVEWQKLHPALGARVLRLFAERQGLVQGLYAAHIGALESLCAGPSGRQIDLPQGRIARLDYGRLRILSPGDMRAEPGFCLPLHLGQNPTPWGMVTVTARRRPSRLGLHWPAAVECNPEALMGALLRPPRPGDRMQPLGMQGTKKLSDIWTDKKIPSPRRNKVVVVRGGEVLLLPGVCVSAQCDAKHCREVWEVRYEEGPAT